MAAAINLSPITGCSFFRLSSVSSSASVAVALPAVSTTLATMSSWLACSWVPDIVWCGEIVGCVGHRLGRSLFFEVLVASM